MRDGVGIFIEGFHGKVDTISAMPTTDPTVIFKLTIACGSVNEEQLVTVVNIECIVLFVV